ncbi:MAG: sugar ABC transporter ATP-binding protein [Solibacillus sp.]
MTEYILKIKNIKKAFGGVQALKGVSLAIKKGEVHSLAGENGCGKSTLIKIISGFYTADEGSLEFDGQTFKQFTPTEAIRQGVQVIYQDFSLFPNLTVMENLSLNLELMNKRKIISYKRLRKIAEQAISKINFKIDLDEVVENLSVADKQLIAICRALLNDAKLIIMDEPTTSLNKREVKSLFEVIRSLKDQGIAILFVSHKLEEVFEISESYTIIRNGEKVITGQTADLDDQKFAYYMTGKEFEQDFYTPKHADSEVILEVGNLLLKNTYKNISFQLKKGEILGITGLLGSGRSEIVQTLFGLYQPDSGTIKLNGKPIQIRNIKEATLYGIGYVPPDRLTEGLFLPQSITNNIIVSKINQLVSKLGFLNKAAIKQESDKWVQNLSIKTNNAQNPVQTLSGGNQQKVMLSRWLATDLSILILDGPTVGVDIGAKFDIYHQLRKLADDGLAVIIISDDLRELIHNCNDIIVIRQGEIAERLVAMDTSEKELADLSTK